ncbi:MAG: HAD family phosphatase [Anaerolineae bacterium]|nr:HAD family phosphatase [Anaerolineae bacterium]
MNAKIALVALDLDGTVMDAHQYISPRVRRAIARSRQAGVQVTLATGRMFESAQPFAQQLGIDVPLVTGQGGWIQHPEETGPLYHVSLDPEVAIAVLALARREQWHVVLYAGGRIFLHELAFDSDFYDRLLGKNFEVVADLDAIVAKSMPDKLLFVAEPERIPYLGSGLRACVDGRAEVFRSHAYFIEVAPRHVDKGRGLSWLAHYLGTPQAAVMAIGDQENDLPMLAWAGLGVAMGDASPVVRERADWVAPSLAEDGAAVALETFVLGEV